LDSDETSSATAMRALSTIICGLMRLSIKSLAPAVAWVALAALVGAAQEPAAPRPPKIGQPGKDVIWVPSAPEFIDKMFDLATLTPEDLVVDLGSGDGRNVIAAAKRGARGRGVEYNPDLVALSRTLAREAGVADRALFVEGDMYEADISDATVLALYLLPVNMNKLKPKFAALTPGTRIVANTFGFDDWEPDARADVEGIACSSWCEVLLWIVPARVEGLWRLDTGDTLDVTQAYQVVRGSLSTKGGAVALSAARLRGTRITFTAGGDRYTGEVTGDAMEGTVWRGSGREEHWQARKQTSGGRGPASPRSP
jgi:SAM-dependent methyltransferase